MDRDAIYRETIRHFLGPIGPLMTHPEVTEVMVMGPETVYYERKGRIRKADLRFPGARALEAAARNIAEYVGRPLGPDHPSLDARLPDGSRVHVLLPPAARDGVCLTIRRFLRSSFDLDTLVSARSLSPEAAEYLELCVLMKKNIVISGGTGTGKTSFLNALSRSIPQAERVIVIEDSSELRLHQPHTIYLESQPGDEDGIGQLTIRDLFVNALRMRPDRVIIGEVRRGEAIDLIQAMLAGHPGSLTTVHANDPKAALIRLEHLCRLNELSLPADVARAQVAMAIDVSVQLVRDPEGTRAVSSIAEVDGVDNAGRYAIRPLFARRADASSPDTSPQCLTTGSRSGFLRDLDAAGLADRASHCGGIFEPLDC